MSEPVMFTGTISDVKVVKTGVSNGREWSLWEVHATPEGDDTPQKFITFENEWRDKVGQKVAFFYQEETRGKFTNLRITGDPEKQKRKRVPNQRGQVEILEAIQGLERKLDAALEWIRERG